MQKFNRYKNNLKYDNNSVYSYNTIVGNIKDNRLIALTYHSKTTNKHVMYAAAKLNLELLRSYGKEKKENAYFSSLELLNNKKISKKCYESLQKMIFSDDKENLELAIVFIKIKTSKKKKIIL